MPADVPRLTKILIRRKPKCPELGNLASPLTSACLLYTSPSPETKANLGKMETTLARAKEIKPLAEKMITLGKKSDLAAYRQAMSFITREDVCKKLFKEIAPSYAERNGGYTRVIRTGVRRGDAAETAIIELVK